MTEPLNTDLQKEVIREGVEPEVEHQAFVSLVLRRLPMADSFFVRDYRWMWTSSTMSMMSMNMQMLTRVWLVLRLMNDSPIAVVYIVMTFALPVIVVSLVGGTLADRFPKRTMMMYAQSGNAVLTLLVATLDFTGLITFWHLIIVGLVNGSMMAINMPSRQAILSDILPEDKLMNGISMMNSGMNVTRIVGPALAGVFILWVGTAGVFYLIAVLYAISVLAIVPLDAGRLSKPHSGKSMGVDIREGFAYAMANPTLRGLIIMAFIPVMFGMSYHVLLPAWARETLDVESDQLGVLQMLMGFGALVGSLGLASMRNFKRRGVLILVCCIAWGLALTVFSYTASYVVAAPLLFFIGLTSAVYMSLNMTMLQIYASTEMRGRIMSISMMTFGIMPLSAVPFGIMAETQRYTTADALALSGVMLVVFTVIFALGYPRFRQIE